MVNMSAMFPCPCLLNRLYFLQSKIRPRAHLGKVIFSLPKRKHSSTTGSAAEVRGLKQVSSCWHYTHSAQPHQAMPERMNRWGRVREIGGHRLGWTKMRLSPGLAKPELAKLGPSVTFDPYHTVTMQLSFRV